MLMTELENLDRQIHAGVRRFSARRNYGRRIEDEAVNHRSVPRYQTEDWPQKFAWPTRKEMADYWGNDQATINSVMRRMGWKDKGIGE